VAAVSAVMAFYQLVLAVEIADSMLSRVVLLLDVTVMSAKAGATPVFSATLRGLYSFSLSVLFVFQVPLEAVILVP